MADSLNHNLMTGYCAGSGDRHPTRFKDKAIDKLYSHSHKHNHSQHPGGVGGGSEKRIKSGSKKRDNEMKDKGQDNHHHHEGVEQRLQAFSAGLENDKQVQIQFAINEFHAKEEAKIRQELSQKLEFELWSREKELIEGFRLRSASLRESLEAEKAGWKIKKLCEEKELMDMTRINHAQVHAHNPTPS